MKIPFLMMLWILSFSTCLASTDLAKGLASEGDYANLPQTAKFQAQPTGDATPAGVVLARDKMAHEFQVLREENKVKEVIALCILAFVSLISVLYFLAKKDENPGVHIVHATGLIFIIFGTITLVIMAGSDEQLTAAIGILGGVAGYLFGSMKGREADSGKNVAVKSRNERTG